MNSSDTKRPLIVGLLLILLATGFMMLAGFISWKATAAMIAPTPEDAVRQLLQTTQDGHYAEAAALLEGGPDAWERSPGLVEQYLDRITDRGNARTFEVLNQGAQRDEHLLQIATYNDKAEPLRVATWYFTRKGPRWVIRKVE